MQDSFVFTRTIEERKNDNIEGSFNTVSVGDVNECLAFLHNFVR